MSNILKTIDFLNGAPEQRFVTVVDGDNSQIGKKEIYLADIPNQDLAAYIKLYSGQSKSKVFWVELRQKQGISSQKKGVFSIEVAEPVQQAPAVAPIPATIVEERKPETSFLGSPTFGLGFGEIMTMHTNSALLTETRTRLEETKKELEAEKHERRKLEIDLRNALTDVSKAEAKEALAVLMAKAENKGFLDGDGVQKLLEKVPDMLEKYAALKHGAAPTAEAGALGGSDLTPVQKEALTWMAENLDDSQIIFLGSICRFMGDQKFVDDVKGLIQSYSNAG